MKALLSTTIALLLLSSASSALALSYLTGESTDFTGNGCQNTDLNTVTSSLSSELNADGWSGYRWTNSSSFPQDFVEACSSSYGTYGIDSAYGDASLLSVYAGHGNRGLLQWGYQRYDRCIVDFRENMRLGSMAGARAGYGMYITSCTLNTSSLVQLANWQWLHQQFGYHNSPSVKDDQPRSFYRSTWGSSNKNAWLNEMEDRPGWFTGDNSPIVVTYASSSDQCGTLHNWYRFRLRQFSGVPRGNGPACGAGQPQFWYCYTLRNNGQKGC